MLQQLRVAPGTLVMAAAWQWTGVGLAMLATTAVFVAMAAYVWRRGGSAGAALALVLVALLPWAGTYAAELGATDLAAISRWGDVRYVGLVLLPPAWFAFAALFAGRGSWVNRRNLALLAIHPILVLVLLIVSCLVLVWGLFRFRLLGIRPVARGLVFETISEAVLVLDPLGRVVDANPPAERLLGLPVAELLPEAVRTRRRPATGRPRSWR